MRDIRVTFSRFWAHVPIVMYLRLASRKDWAQATVELFVILFFSLMPIWLGILGVQISSAPDSAADFLSKFASSSDLGILSASLLGPLLYMLFRSEGRSAGERPVPPLIPPFPNGLSFVITIIFCCVVASVLYCFTYLSAVRPVFDSHGIPIALVNPHMVAAISWMLFAVSILLVLSAATIRNTLYSRPTELMQADTGDFVQRLRDAESGNA